MGRRELSLVAAAAVLLSLLATGSAQMTTRRLTSAPAKVASGTAVPPTQTCAQQLAATRASLVKAQAAHTKAQANATALSTLLRSCNAQKATKAPQQVSTKAAAVQVSTKAAAAPVAASPATAAPTSLTACKTQLAQAVAEIDDIRESLMLQLQDALAQNLKLKADLAAASKTTATAQALADKAVQERDAATEASETCRQRVSLLVAEAQEAAEIQSGLQETIAQANQEKDATAKELTSCRGELTKATRDTADLGNQLVTCQQYSGPLAAQLEEAKSHLSTCEADLQACQQTDNLALAAGN